MSKTIAIVSNTSWSIYNFRLTLIENLMRMGYKVLVIAPKDNFTSKLIAKGVAYEAIKINNYGTHPIKELLLVRQLHKIYKKRKPSLIFHYTIKPNIYGSFAAYLNGIPNIAITTGLGHLFDFKNAFITRLTFIMYRLAAKLCNEMWFLNHNDLDVFVYKNIVSREKSSVLRSEGIDLNWFSPTDQKLYAYPVRFLFAGRILWDKGVQQFVDAAKIIKQRGYEVEFSILGFVDQNNPNSVPFEKISQWQNEGWINYLGERTDVRKEIQETHCLLFPSYYREGVSRILMEAAAMETPIITTDNVGCRDVVDHGRNGYLSAPKNVTDLVSAIEQFIALSTQDKMVMGKLGRKKMEREFSMDKVLSKYHDTIDKYLGKKVNLKKSKVYE